MVVAFEHGLVLDLKALLLEELVLKPVLEVQHLLGVALLLDRLLLRQLAELNLQLNQLSTLCLLPLVHDQVQLIRADSQVLVALPEFSLDGYLLVKLDVQLANLSLEHVDSLGVHVLEFGHLGIFVREFVFEPLADLVFDVFDILERRQLVFALVVAQFVNLLLELLLVLVLGPLQVTKFLGESLLLLIELFDLVLLPSSLFLEFLVSVCHLLDLLGVRRVDLINVVFYLNEPCLVLFDDGLLVIALGPQQRVFSLQDSKFLSFGGKLRLAVSEDVFQVLLALNTDLPQLLLLLREEGVDLAELVLVRTRAGHSQLPLATA